MMNPAPGGGMAPAPSPTPAAQPGVTFNGNEGPAVPAGGHAKFFNASTGQYDWQSHAREAEWVATHDAAFQTLGRALASGADGVAERVALANLGVPEAVVNQYVSATRVTQAQAVRVINEYAGQQLAGDSTKGAEAITQMKAWVAQNLPAEKRQELNNLVASGHARLAIDHVKGLMGGNPGGMPNVDMGGPGGGAGGAFANVSEQNAAINDPRYRADPGYRAQVQARIIATRRSR